MELPRMDWARSGGIILIKWDFIVGVCIILSASLSSFTELRRVTPQNISIQRYQASCKTLLFSFVIATHPSSDNVIINCHRHLHFRRLCPGFIFGSFRLRVFLIVYGVAIHNEVWPNDGGHKLVRLLTMTDTGKRIWGMTRNPSYILLVGWDQLRMFPTGLNKVCVWKLRVVMFQPLKRLGDYPIQRASSA